MRILDRIQCHDDLVALTDSERMELCREIREYLVSKISKTGGHLASNLGVVELTVALETVFDTRLDRLVFDVGHQSYIHKLLTGRQADFAHLRQFGGIAGFPKPGESETDAFVAGHASNSVSIALGMARARTLQNQKYDVVAVMGDGAATGGMIYEGLNDAGGSKEPMVVVLNDNKMSIDRNVGGISKHLSRLRTKQRYLGTKDKYRRIMKKLPGCSGIFEFTRRVKEWVKRMILPGTFFENMGFSYLGPVDGHDLPELISVLRGARDMKEPVLIHVITQKGRGYRPAEEHPSKFHGVGKFNPETGDIAKKEELTFSDAFGQAMVRLAAENPKLCAITAAMPGGTGLLDFKERYPKRLFDVGIAEEHAVSMAGGLAKQGMIPVVALYSTFLQRSYDQIMQDIALLHLPVILAVDRAGLVGEDGETHHGIFDVGFLRQMPGLEILCPASCRELEDMLFWAAEGTHGPVAIRYPRGSDKSFRDSCWHNQKLHCHRTGKDFTVITYGTMLENVMQAAQILSQQGIEITVLRLLRLTEITADTLLPYVQGDILVVEEVADACGIYTALSHEIRKSAPDKQVFGLNLGKHFVTHGSMETLYNAYGLDGQGIANRIREVRPVEN